MIVANRNNNRIKFFCRVSSTLQTGFSSDKILTSSDTKHSDFIESSNPLISRRCGYLYVGDGPLTFLAESAGRLTTVHFARTLSFLYSLLALPEQQCLSSCNLPC